MERSGRKEEAPEVAAACRRQGRRMLLQIEMQLLVMQQMRRIAPALAPALSGHSTPAVAAVAHGSVGAAPIEKLHLAEHWQTEVEQQHQPAQHSALLAPSRVVHAADAAPPQVSSHVRMVGHGCHAAPAC